MCERFKTSSTRNNKICVCYCQEFLIALMWFFVTLARNLFFITIQPLAETEPKIPRRRRDTFRFTRARAKPRSRRDPGAIRRQYLASGAMGKYRRNGFVLASFWLRLKRCFFYEISNLRGVLGSFCKIAIRTAAPPPGRAATPCSPATCQKTGRRPPRRQFPARLPRAAPRPESR